MVPGGLSVVDGRHVTEGGLTHTMVVPTGLHMQANKEKQEMGV